MKKQPIRLQVLPSRRCPAAPPPDPPAASPPAERRPPARHPPVGHLLPEGEAPQLLLQRLVRRGQLLLLRDPGGARRLPATLGPPAAAAARRPRLLPAGRGGGVHCSGAAGPSRRRRRGQGRSGRRLQALGGGGGGRGTAAPGAAGRAASRGGCKWQRDRAASIGGRTAAGHCGKLLAGHARRHAPPAAGQWQRRAPAAPPRPRPAEPRPATRCKHRPEPAQVTPEHRGALAFSHPPRPLVYCSPASCFQFVPPVISIWCAQNQSAQRQRHLTSIAVPLCKVNCTPTFWAPCFSLSPLGDTKENFRGKWWRVSAQELAVTIRFKNTEKVEVYGYTEIIAGIMHRNSALFSVSKSPLR